jgi:hypothetical protein
MKKSVASTRKLPQVTDRQTPAPDCVVSGGHLLS